MNAHEAERRVAATRQIPLLARLTDEERRALARRGVLRRFARGAVIFGEGDPGAALYIVIEGRVRVSRLHADGGEAVLAFRGPGEALGELSLLDGLPRSAAVTATEDSTALVISRLAFEAWLREQPSAALPLLRALSGRLREASEALADVGMLNLRARIARLLVDEMRVAPAGSPSTLHVTQQDLAGKLLVSREAVNKCLHEFKAMGWVSTRRGTITILRADALGAVGQRDL